MTLDDRLNLLRTAGLIRDAGTVSEKEYLFQHALLQEAAYDSLLKQDRKRLHLAVGNALEQSYPERLDELAPLLARHFAEASDDSRALTYFILAGEHALRQYAFPEVIAHYTSALAVAPRVGAPLAKLYRARGLAYEGHGEYARARADQEAALQFAQAAHDPQAEWQALIDLGKLWAERDYGKTGEYFQRAFDLARTLDDPGTLAHSLNRLGNWYTNVERPLDALHHLHQALTIFQQLGDRRGIAQTLDLLGMTNALSGDLIESAAYYRQAIALFRELHERVDLVSSLTSLGLGAAEYQVTTAVLAAIDLADALREVEQSVQLAREIGWRSAEAFALIVSANLQGSRGDFTLALESNQRGLQVAEEIGHRQWMTYAHGAFGMIYTDLFAPSAAREHLEQALTLAQEIGSRHWIRAMSGFLSSGHIREHDLARAQQVLDAVPSADDPAHALEIIDQLIASAAHALPDGSNILRVSMLRGQTFTALGRFEEAEPALIAAREIAEVQGALPALWQIHAALGKLYRTQERGADSAAVFHAARAIAAELAEKISNAALRKGFEKGVRDVLE